jgi:hypothetical protein
MFLLLQRHFVIRVELHSDHKNRFQKLLCFLILSDKSDDLVISYFYLFCFKNKTVISR